MIASVTTKLRDRPCSPASGGSASRQPQESGQRKRTVRTQISPKLFVGTGVIPEAIELMRPTSGSGSPQAVVGPPALERGTWFDTYPGRPATLSRSPRVFGVVVPFVKNAAVFGGILRPMLLL